MSTRKNHSFQERGLVYSYEEEIPHLKGGDDVWVRHTLPRNGEYDIDEALVYAGGWVTGIAVNQFCADALAARGRHVVTVDHSRRTTPRGLKAEAFKGMTISSVVEAVTSTGGANRIVAKADSEGGLHMVDHMSRALEAGDTRVEAAVFAMAAGCHGKDTAAELTARATADMLTGGRRLLDRNLARSAFRAWKYIAANPRLSLNEVLEIAGADSGPKIASLHRAGIPMAFIVGEKDHFFSPDRVEKNLRKHCGEDIPEVRRISTDHIGCAIDLRVVHETDNLLKSLTNQAKTDSLPALTLASLLPAQRSPADSKTTSSRSQSI